MDADAEEATAEDAMDHEFDSTGHKDETSSGSGSEGAPDPGPPLEEPPKGPNSAHFREAARLAAARARKAIEQERQSAQTTPTKKERPKPDVDEKTFKIAARKRAMHVSGRDPEESDSLKTSMSGKQASGSTEVREDRKRDVKKELTQLDERLMLGARMLRAFESQIQRLDAAASRAELPLETSQQEPTTTDPAPAAPGPDTTQQEAVLEEAEQKIAHLELQIRKATDAAESLANSIEISGAIASERNDWTEQARRSEEQLAQRAESVQARTEHALESMERTFRRVMEIERAVMTRIDQAMNRLEQKLDPATPPVTGSAAGNATKRAPLIEVEPRAVEPQSELPPKPEPVDTPTTEADSLSVGTLSIDTTLRTRRLQGGS